MVDLITICKKIEPFVMYYKSLIISYVTLCFGIKKYKIKFKYKNNQKAVVHSGFILIGQYKNKSHYLPL